MEVCRREKSRLPLALEIELVPRLPSSWGAKFVSCCHLYHQTGSNWAKAGEMRKFLFLTGLNRRLGEL